MRIAAGSSPRSSSARRHVDEVVAATRSHADAGRQGAGQARRERPGRQRRRRPRVSTAIRFSALLARPTPVRRRRSSPTPRRDAQGAARVRRRRPAAIDSRRRGEADGDPRLAGAGLRTGRDVQREDGQPHPRKAIMPTPRRCAGTSSTTGSSIGPTASTGGAAARSHRDALRRARRRPRRVDVADPDSIPPPGTGSPSRHQRVGFGRVAGADQRSLEGARRPGAAPRLRPLTRRASRARPVVYDDRVAAVARCRRRRRPSLAVPGWVSRLSASGSCCWVC